MSLVTELVDLIKLQIFLCGRSAIKGPVVEMYWISHCYCLVFAVKYECVSKTKH